MSQPVRLIVIANRTCPCPGLADEVGVHLKGQPGEVGDADPLNGLADAHSTFGAHAILLSTWPEGMSHWLERDLLARARKRVGVPVHHVVSRYDAPLPAAA